jgi:leader peptidase (prepilin peptidase)/N-methyltransferase
MGTGAMLIYFWLFLVFVVGLVVGSFLNVCVARLPLEKSLLWPGSRCGSCLQPVRWYDNLPLVSYLVLRGRCRTCGARFSIRYFLVELATALGFVGLFYAEMVLNVHGWPERNRAWQIAEGLYPGDWWAGYVWHALLFSFLMVAAACDLGGREIPLPLTLAGTFIGLIGAVCFPWPWPHSWAEILQPLSHQDQVALQGSPWWQLQPFSPRLNPFRAQDPVRPPMLPEGLYPWPLWGPLPSWLPAGSWQLGLLTGLAGALTGTLLMRAVSFLFSTGLGKEAMGMGDADLMMMAGAFLGWQVVVVAFFLSVVPALVFGIINVAVKNDNSLPFGPSLAAGVLLTMLVWRWLAPQLQVLLFHGLLLLIVAGVAAGFFLISSFVVRVLKTAV